MTEGVSIGLNVSVMKLCACVMQMCYFWPGICTKNGAHCAFAHGSADLRNPTYDLREMQAMERGESPIDGPAVEMSTSMEKERILNDDPKWNGESVRAVYL